MSQKEAAEERPRVKLRETGTEATRREAAAASWGPVGRRMREAGNLLEVLRWTPE